MTKKKTALALVLACFFLHAEAPWFTGPLIAPPGTAIPYGRFMIKPQMPFTVYRPHFFSANPQLSCFFGLTPWCDINIIPQFFYQTTSHEHDVQFGDLTVGLDFQLLDADATPYFPGIKFAIREVFPTGNFQFLRAKKLGTDRSGEGTFATQAALVFYKEFHLYQLYWLAMTASAQYTINTPVHVQGFNAYGGGFGAKGTVLPGNAFQGIVSFELSLSQNWALAMDSVYTHKDESEFFGRPGIALMRTFATVGGPSSDQLSFAFGLEYNFSAHLGIIGGYWFSALSRNIPEFQSGVVNVRYLY
ncbi:MAG: hypothetical protein K1X28_06770 [Parachlamydiales bacterium]|nr:hypothetical protein [Parachlamydiales bacterium]